MDGYPDVMAPYPLSGEQLDALIAYIQSLSGDDTPAQQIQGDASASADDTDPADTTLSGTPAQQGKQLAEANGCLACHSVDGSKSLGPGWLGLYGKTETLADGSTLSVDASYIEESIVNPSAKIVRDYPPVMVAYEFSEEQLAAITAYIQSLTSEESSAPQADTPMNKNITPQD